MGSIEFFFNQKIGKSSWKQGKSLKVFEKSNGCEGRTEKGAVEGGDTSEEAAQVAPG